MMTYYNGYDIQWLDDGTFRINRKRFKTLRKTMDWVDKKRARVNNNLDTSNPDSHT